MNILESVTVAYLSPSYDCRKLIVFGDKTEYEKLLGKNIKNMFRTESKVNKTLSTSNIIGGDSSSSDDLSDLAAALMSDDLNTSDSIFNSAPTADNKSIGTDISKKPKFSLYSIYPFDTIATIKEKIYATAHIEPFKQHLFIYNPISGVVPLSYTYMVNNVPTSVSYVNIEKSESKIKDTPVYLPWSNMRDQITIHGLDWFTVFSSVYKKYGTNLIFMLNLDDYTYVDLDRSSHEILYHGFIKPIFPYLANYTTYYDYINKPIDSFIQIYPKLIPKRSKLKDRFAAEKKIVDGFIKCDCVSGLEAQINFAITSATITISSYGTVGLILLNVFNEVALDAKISAVRYYYLDRGVHTVTKYYHEQSSFPVVSSINSLTYRIGNVMVTITQNGKITVRANYEESEGMDFDTIMLELNSTIVDLFVRINNVPSAFTSNSLDRLPTKITSQNSHISEVNLSLIWGRSFLDKDLRRFNKVVQNLSSAGWWEQGNKSEFFLKMPAFKYNIGRLSRLMIVNNTYEWLTINNVKQRWETLFNKSRALLITPRVNDVHMSIIGVREEEFKYFYIFILILIQLTSKELRSMTTSRPTSEATLEQILRAAEKNPLKLLKDQDPLFYRTPMDEPYSKICQRQVQPVILTKNQMLSLPAEDQKRVVSYWNFSTNNPANYYCHSKRHKYVKFIHGRHPLGCIACCGINPIERASDRRRIIHQMCLDKKVIDLAELPERDEGNNKYIIRYGKNIAPGRLSSMPKSTAFGKKFAKYFLMGQPQDHPYWSAIANAYDKSVEEMKSKYLQDIESDPLRGVIIGDNPILYAKWFLDTTLIEINSGVALNTFGEKKLQPRLIILIKSTGMTNPIVSIIPKIYFATGGIEKTYFEEGDDIYDEMNKIILDNQHFELKFDLDNLKRFTLHSKWNIDKIYLDKKGSAVYCDVSRNDKKVNSKKVNSNEKKSKKVNSKIPKCRIPIHRSSITTDDFDILSIYYRNKIAYKTQSHNIMNFISDYERISKSSVDLISIGSKRMIQYSGKCIGMEWDGLMFLGAVSSSQSKYERKVNYKYCIEDINGIIASEDNSEPPHKKKLVAAKYSVMVWRHFIILFSYEVMKDKNTKVRSILEKKITTYDFTRQIEGLIDLIAKMNLSPVDSKHILNIISVHNDKLGILLSIEKSYFEFDRASLIDVSTKPIGVIKKKIEKICKKFAVVGSRKELLPHKIYCTKEIFDNVVTFFAERVRTNPLDLYIGLDINKSLTAGRFTKHPGEKIFIT
jgi:hypothetical protein